MLVPGSGGTEYFTPLAGVSFLLFLKSAILPGEHFGRLLAAAYREPCKLGAFPSLYALDCICPLMHTIKCGMDC